jgi:hypothetical protein
MMRAILGEVHTARTRGKLTGRSLYRPYRPHLEALS